MSRLQTGVWHGPRGLRMEVSQVSDARWCIALFPSRYEAVGTSLVCDTTDAAERVHQLEASGYVYQPGQQPGAESRWEWDRHTAIWTAILGVLVLVVAVIAAR